MKLLVGTVVLILSTVFGLPEPLKPIDWDRVRPVHQLESWRKFHPVLAEHFPITTDSNRIGGRIVNGEIAEPHSYPYQIAVFGEFPEGIGLCGGSIITANYVLTAAHCVDITPVIEILAGAHNIRILEPTQVRFRIEAVNIFVHSEWSIDFVRNDIATVKLPNALEWNDYVQIISLPPRSLLDVSFAGELGIVTGWGRFDNNLPLTSDVLRRVELYVITNEECKLSFPDHIFDNNICTSGAELRSPCNSDSGGPLVVNQGDKLMQVGIVSFVSIHGCDFGEPAAYARVTSFASWIEANSDYVFV